MHNQIRCLCTTMRLQSLGGAMNKVMNSHIPKKKRRKNHNFMDMPLGLPTFFNKSNAPQQTQVSKRVTILNKIFMKNITDLMATGEVAPSLIGRGIEVTHVEVTNDFAAVNVYWISQDANNALSSTEDVLKIAAGHLQHELSQLRVVGKVPKINFVKNKKYFDIKEVENRLATVDFGEDFEPTAHIITSHDTPILRTSVSQKIKKQLEKLEQENQINNNEIKVEEETDHDLYEIQVPQMRQNVIGFDHEYVLSKIKLSIGKVKSAEDKRKLCLPELPQGSGESFDASDFLSSEISKDNIDDFIKKRLLDEKRRRKAKPLHEVKLEAETEWHQIMENDDIHDDVFIEDELIDDNYETDNYK